LYYFWDVTSVLLQAIVINAALMASQRQRRAWTFHLHPPVNNERKLIRRQVPFFQSSVWPVWDSNLANLCGARTIPLGHRNWKQKHLFYFVCC